MAYGREVQFEVIREVAFGGIGAAFAALGGALTDNARLVMLSNSTDVEIDISIDGVNRHLKFAPNSAKTFDLTANKVRDDGYFLPVNTTFYIRQTAGAATLGSFWIETMIAGGGI